ncbi:MAG: hypothetical protein F6J93_29120 [Oscillatoria sp. SIO1A7]|nr:hypothetical protein [Oscillatoria sp. SIO1A7]
MPNSALPLFPMPQCPMPNAQCPNFLGPKWTAPIQRPKFKTYSTTGLSSLKL